MATNILTAAAIESRAAEVQLLATEQGVRGHDVPFLAGAELRFVTERTARRDRFAPYRCPTLADAMRDLVQLVTGEERRDSTVSTHNLGIDPESGELQWCDGPALPGLTPMVLGERPYLRRAYSQLVASLAERPPHASQYQLAIPPSRRSSEFAFVLQGNDPREVTMRFRRSPLPLIPGGEDQTQRYEARHHVFAVVTPDYVDYGPLSLAPDLLTAFGDDAERLRCAVFYRGVTTSIRVFSADEVGQTGANAFTDIDSADDGSASVRLSSGIQLRTGATFHATHGKEIRRIVHRGNVERFERELADGLEAVKEHVQPWLELWGERSAVALPADGETCIGALTGALGGTPWFAAQGIDTAAITCALTETWGRDILEGATEHTASQADLAHCFAAATLRHEWDANTAAKLQDAAQALLTMTPKQLERIILRALNPESDTKTQGIAPANLAVADAINDRIERARRWRAAAAAAKEQGDDHSAQVATEHAELLEIEGTVIEETGIA